MSPEYMQALGEAVYNFSRLEWEVIYIEVRRNNDIWENVPLGRPSNELANALKRSIERATWHLSRELRTRLFALEQRYRQAFDERNRLLHGYPYVAEDGGRLWGRERTWTLDSLRALAASFSEIEGIGNALHREVLASRGHNEGKVLNA